MKVFRRDEFGRVIWPTAFFGRPLFSTGQGSFGGGAPAGGSDGSQGGQQSQGGGVAGQGAQGQPQGQGQQGQPGLSELGSGFLNRVSPEHRSILEPYVSQWDAGVTRRFQDLHNQFRPFQELGSDPETLSHALNIYQMLDENPQELVRLITEQMGDGMSQGQPGGGGQGTLPGEPGQQTPGAASPEIQQALQKITALEGIVEKLAEGHLSQREKETQANEDAQLDQYLGLLQKEFGDFDENYVLAQMMSGVDGQEAVQAFQKLVQGQVNQRGVPQVPAILGGGGSVPQQQQSVAKASRGDVRNLVANLVADAARQSH